MKKFLYIIAILLIIGFVYRLFNPEEISEDTPPIKNDIETADHHDDSINAVAKKETYLFEYEDIDSLELPKFKSSMQIVRHSAYTVSYNESYEHSNWVAYELLCDETIKVAERKDNFRPDPKVLTGTAEVSDYRRSGYDRGHLMPAADNSFSAKAMSESFYFSNMSPQEPGFNRGIWRILEEQVRVWACQYDKLYVITGGILKPGLKTIGKNNVSIPEYYFKTLLVYNEDKQSSISFLMKNESSSSDILSFAVPTDSIEKLTEYDFFPRLDDSIEEEVENNVNLNDWYIAG